MKKIKGYYHISNSLFEKFNKDVERAIRRLQEDGQEVEIQYTTCTNEMGLVVYNALIIGRMDFSYH